MTDKVIFVTRNIMGVPVESFIIEPDESRSFGDSFDIASYNVQLLSREEAEKHTVEIEKENEKREQQRKERKAEEKYEQGSAGGGGGGIIMSDFNMDQIKWNNGF